MRQVRVLCPVSCVLSSMMMNMSFEPFAKPCYSILCGLVSFPPGPWRIALCQGQTEYAETRGRVSSERERRPDSRLV